MKKTLKDIETIEVPLKTKKRVKKASRPELSDIIAPTTKRKATKMERVREIQRDIKIANESWDVTLLKLFRIVCVGIVFYAAVSLILSAIQQAEIKRHDGKSQNIAEAIVCKGKESDYNCQQARFQMK